MDKRTKLQSWWHGLMPCSFLVLVSDGGGGSRYLSNKYGDAKAGPFKLVITQFGFIIILVVAEFLLAQRKVDPLSKMLQNM